jgi:hypothetical protein
VAEVALRPIDDSDLDALFEQMRDPESVRMAAFTAENPDVRSLKVLQRAGFAIIGTEVSFANARNKEIEETILRLDEPAESAPPGASTGDRQTY